MRLLVETDLNCSAARAWAEVQKPELLVHVASPVLVFIPRAPTEFPPAGLDGEFVVSMKLFGLLPLGRQTIRVSRHADPDGSFHLRDDGFSDVIRKWDHRISLTPLSECLCHYTDTIDIEAGLLTPVVFCFAFVFFRWRQHRWRQLVAREFRYR